jgi:hypothetical protein
MYSSGPVAMAHPRHYAESSVAYHPRAAYAAAPSSSYPPRRDAQYDAPLAYSHDAYGRPMPSAASTSFAMVPRGVVSSAYEESLISPMHQQPTYIGYIKTASDAILLLSACDLPANAGLARGACPPPRCVTRRLLDSERATLIRSGSVFAWDEKSAGMRRWTDGKCWSASRVSGCFLTYRELEVRKKPASSTANGSTVATANQYKVDGLIKQSFTITTRSGRKLHVISYYTKRDFREGRLRRVSEDPRFVGEGGGEWGLSVDEDEYRDPTLRDADAPCLSPVSPFNALHPSPRALLQHAPLPQLNHEPAPSSSRHYYSAYDLPSPPSSSHDVNRRNSGPTSVLAPVPAAAGMKRSASHSSRDEQRTESYMAPPASQRRRGSSTYSNSGAEQSFGSSEPRTSIQSGASSAATTVDMRSACEEQQQQARRPPPLQLVHSAFGGARGSPSAVGALLSLRTSKSVGSLSSGPSPRLFSNMPLPGSGGSHPASPTSPLPPMLSTSDRSALNKLTVRL